MKCLTCRHCTVQEATGPYSDYTPGDPLAWLCSKGLWMSNMDDKREVWETFIIGETCEQWQADGRSNQGIK